MIPNRAELDANGYDRLCTICKYVAVHKLNSEQVCPDCAATQRASEKDTLKSFPAEVIKEPEPRKVTVHEFLDAEIEKELAHAASSDSFGEVILGDAHRYVANTLSKVRAML